MKVTSEIQEKRPGTTRRPCSLRISPWSTPTTSTALLRELSSDRKSKGEPCCCCCAFFDHYSATPISTRQPPPPRDLVDESRVLSSFIRIIWVFSLEIDDHLVDHNNFSTYFSFHSHLTLTEYDPRIHCSSLFEKSEQNRCWETIRNNDLDQQKKCNHNNKQYSHQDSRSSGEWSDGLWDRSNIS